MVGQLSVEKLSQALDNLVVVKYERGGAHSKTGAVWREDERLRG